MNASAELDPFLSEYDQDEINILSASTTVHPLDRDNAILPTRPLEEFVNVLREWLDARLTGGVIWGHQRMGKTQAIRYLMKNSSQALGAPIPMGLMSTWDPTHSSLTENRFFGAVLTALGYAAPNSGTAAIKRQRIIDFITEQVNDADEYRYLLFIDEAQLLAEVQLRYLMDLHNQLKIGDIHLVCILVGQPELKKIRISLRNNKQAHLLGRFMSATHQYTGVCSEPDLARIAFTLDEQSEFPAGSGISYSQYYVPLAFKSGWRLSKHSSDIWGLLETTLETHSLPKCNEYPMQAIMSLFVWLLHELAKQDGADMQVSRSLIEEGIHRRALLSIQDQLSLVS